MRRTFLALVAAVLVALLPLGAAQAKEYTAGDPTGDVKKFSETEEGTPSPETANGDITRVRYTHGDKAVIVVAKYRALSKAGAFRLDFARIVTSAGWKRDVTIVAGEGWWVGDSMLSKPDGTPVKCKLAHSLDYVNERVTVRVPRGCLGNPGWVRIGMGSAWMTEEAVYVDEALSTTVNDMPKLSPRIGRG